MEFDQFYFVEIKSNPEYVSKSPEEEQERLCQPARSPDLSGAAQHFAAVPGSQKSA